MLTTLAVSGYRSLRDIRLELQPLNIVTGPNGSGKSSLYRSLRLLADIAQGRVIRALASEGGLNSTLWAGPEAFSREMKAGRQPVQGVVRKGPISLKLGFASEDYGYAIDLGMPASGTPTLEPSKFNHDPQIKAESLWVGQVLRPRNEIASRKGTTVSIRNDGHAWETVIHNLSPFDSMMTHAANPKGAVELLMLREFMRGWRFYDHFRTDRDAPARMPQVGTYTPVLAGDGSDLAAAIQTLIEVGEAEDFAAAVDDAFPDATIEIETHQGYFELLMYQKGLLRPLKAMELSDGTLRYLLLIAALLSPRSPQLMVLNEPEMSLHPDLLAPLGRLIAKASKRSQVIVVSHADGLIRAIEAATEAQAIGLEKHLGETQVTGCETPLWEWPSR